ncbi:WXG100 family type VII secretion target [Prauserella oleivorans]|uniref:WXG100 family type VII secretion target n=1 Tax=Prauserella oleivorans TaxID=1478153 RepID=A0ABW5WF98_9PSEU
MSDYQPGDVGLHDPKDLVEGETGFAGAGIIDAGAGLASAIQENDKVAIGIGSAGLALETLGLALDPIGSVLTAGIGWLIEHISILRWPLDFMMGDPVGIAAATDAIKAEQEKLADWSREHTAALEKLMAEWSGDAAEQFRKDMEAVGEQLGLLGDYVASAAKQMEVAGGLVGAFRGIIRDFIAMLLAGIIKGALIAAALAPVTFGASIAVFIGTAIGTVATALGKIGAQIAELTRLLAKQLASLKSLGQAGDEFTAQAGKFGGAGGGNTAAKPGGDSAPPGPKPGAGDPPPPGKPDQNQADWNPESRLDPHAKPLSDKATAIVREKLIEELYKKLGNNPAFTPAAREEILRKFDMISNLSVAQLGKVMGPENAHRFEAVVKTLTDPMYGARGLTGKTLVDIIKGVPQNAQPDSGDEE